MAAELHLPEVTMQFEELLESLKKLKEHRINTAIETNGTHIRTEELFPYVDQLIMDCKLCDPVKHQKYTGGANEEIMKNIRKANNGYKWNLHIEPGILSSE